MDEARYLELCRIFEAACEKPTAERTDFVREACAGDPELLEGVLAALMEVESPTPFLEAPLKVVPDGADSDAPDETPQHFGPFVVRGLLGSGGMGRVYLAEEKHPHRLIALKVVADPLSPVSRLRLEREAELLARLEHPGIARIYRAGSVETPLGPRTYVAMEYVAGESLARRLASAEEESGPCRMAQPEALSLCESVARALHAAHEAGVVHRDVKPENIIVRPDGRPILIDFGIARLLDHSGTRLTRTEALPGTPAYMSPEQVMGGDDVDGRSDVWALGVVLYRLLGGRLPFDAPTPTGLLDDIRRRDPPPIRQVAPHLPRDVAAVVEVALQKEKERRYLSAEALAEDLARARRGEPVAARPPGLLERCWRRARRRPGLALALAASMLLALLLTGALGFLAANWGDIEEGRSARHQAEIEARIQRAFFAFAEGERTRARHLFEELLAEEGDLPEAAAGLAEIHILQGGRRADEEPSPPTGGVTRASPSASTPDGITALSRYLEGLRSLPAAERGDTAAAARARASFLRALMLSPRPRALYYFGLARALAACGKSRREEAADVAQVLLERWPDSALARFHAAFALMETRRRRAITLFQEVLAKDPELASAHTNLGRLMFLEGRTEEALKNLRRAIALQPRSGPAHVNLANTLLHAGRLEEALEEAMTATDLFPDLPATWKVLGNVQRRRGRADDAIRAYEKALDGDPKDDLLRHRLASMLRDAGRLREAARAFEIIVRHDPDRASWQSDLATTLIPLGRLEEAVQACERALAREPGNVPALVNLASAQLSLGRLTSARAAARRATEERPSSPEAWLLLGLAAREDDDPKSARKALAQAHRLGKRKRSWPHPTGRWLADLQGALEKENSLLPNLELVRDGTESPSRGEALLLAAAAFHGEQPDLALRLFSAAGPLDLQGPEVQVRAARAAARCLSGGRAGSDVAALGLRWLGGALKALQEDPSPAPASLRRRLRAWLDDPHLSRLLEAGKQEDPRTALQAMGLKREILAVLEDR